MLTLFNNRPVDVNAWIKGDMGPLITHACYVDTEECEELTDEECDKLSQQMYEDGIWQELV